MSVANGLARLAAEKGALADSAARKRLAGLFDEGSFTELDRFAKNGETPGEVITAYGSIAGAPAYAFSQDVSVASGAMGRVQAGKIARVYDLAAENGLPVVGVYDSNGAHLDEGTDALAAYGELIRKANRLSGVVPQISVVLGACIGTSALLASLADVTVMSKDAVFYCVSPAIAGDKSGRVGSAAAAAAAGTAHVVAEDEAGALETVRELLSLLPGNNLSVGPMADPVAPAVDAATLKAGDRQLTVLEAVADAGSLLELSAAYGSAAHTALCRVTGNPVGVVACDGENEGRLDAAAATKIARFVRMCDAFSIPVITFVDTAGFVADKESELSGSVKEAALLTHAYAEATTQKIAVITGKAYGPAYIALAGRASGTDVVYAWPDATVSALEPLTAVSVLYKDRILAGEKREDLAAAYAADAASPFEAAAKGHIDDVIEPAETYQRIVNALDMLSGKRVSTMDKKHSNMPL